ncbi:ABC transporter permease [Stenotrophomonas maltophilia]|uniref:ABC transporter permease n=1 Tax=Stenotrophomonas maltophilia TaxID=40324 RepID=UPI00066C75BC|nr:ABC transporter permease [Stenotrophomonas maltophilia]
MKSDQYPVARLGSHSLSPIAPFSSLWRNGKLIYELTKRDITGRYRGSVAGSLWAFLTPLLMLAIYSFVFGYIFKSRWTAAESGNVSFPIVLFVGLIFSNFLAECLNRAPALITANPNYVKKVVFPLEVLPWVAVGTALFHALISIFVLLLVMVCTGTPLGPTALLLPVAFLIFVPVIAGLSWMLAALGVYFRDLQQIMAVVTTAMVFLAPIFYPRSMLPDSIRWVLAINPLTYVVEVARGLMLWGQLPSLLALASYALVSLLVAWAGWVCFQLTRRGFADVI